MPAPARGAQTKDQLQLDWQHQPAGVVRLTLDDCGLSQTVWPRLRPVLEAYPDISVELIADYALTDIVAERFDGGVRLGGLIDKDMIAVPIGPDERMAVVAAPTYFRDPRSHHHDRTDEDPVDFLRRLPLVRGLQDCMGSAQGAF